MAIGWSVVSSEDLLSMGRTGVSLEGPVVVDWEGTPLFYTVPLVLHENIAPLALKMYCPVVTPETLLPSPQGSGPLQEKDFIT